MTSTLLAIRASRPLSSEQLHRSIVRVIPAISKSSTLIKLKRRDAETLSMNRKKICFKNCHSVLVFRGKQVWTSTRWSKSKSRICAISYARSMRGTFRDPKSILATREPDAWHSVSCPRLLASVFNSPTKDLKSRIKSKNRHHRKQTNST